VAGDQKNSCRITKMALPNLKRSGFVFNACKNFQPAPTNKTKCRCFFDEHGLVRSHIAGLTKRFGYFGAPK